SVIKHKILSGNQIDPAEINSAAGVNIVQAMQVLHEIDKKGELLKTAQGYKTRTNYNSPLGGSFLGDRSKPLLVNLFGFMNSNMNSKRKGGALALAIGFIVWFIKTVLLSVGLLAGVGAIKKVIIPEKDKQEELGSSDEIGENMYKPEYRQNNQPVYNVKYVPLVQNSP